MRRILSLEEAKTVILKIQINSKGSEFELNIAPKRLNSPAQFWPFPLNPGWHSHTKDPLVFVQVAFT